MAFQIIKGEELKVDGIIVLIYGEPGTGKTSTGFTAPNPVVFDFDGGAHRSGFKVGKSIVRINNWEQIASSYSSIENDLKDYKTIIIDTVETCLDYIRMYIEDKDYKLKQNQLKMYGKLKDEFYGFLNRIKALGKNIILIAHATTEEQNGIVKTVPKITGGSRDIVRQKSDFMGYMFMNNNKRTLNFNPTDYYEGKNSTGLKLIELPDFKDEPEFFNTIIDTMRKSLSDNFKSQDEALITINKFSDKIKESQDISDFEILMSEMGSLNKSFKSQLWKKLKEHALELGFEFHADKQKFEKIKPKEEVSKSTNNVPSYTFE